VVVGVIAGALVWFKFFPDSRFAKVFISERTVGEIGTDRPELLNQTGKALTTLRPSGTAVISGRRIDVVTEGPFIEAGAAVKVVAVEGMRVVVRSV
jgi:membrane-bound serine protease (ClpP class)